MTKKAIITQSNYIPWKGYFDSIAAVDTFVVYDEMQYTKRDWRNRNKIKNAQGLSWLTIPVEVKGKYFQKINETKVADLNWTQSHWGKIKQAYQKAPFYKEISEWLEPLYLKCDFTFLSEINLYFIRAINNYLDIDTKILFSKDFELAEDKTERLIQLCNNIEATDYFSGPAAKDYMNEDSFKKAGIQLHYWDYSQYPEYEQLHGTFEHSVSIIDLLFQKGNEAKNYLKFVK